MIGNELLSKTITLLRFPMTVGVVFLHNQMTSINIQGQNIRFDEWPLVSMVMRLFSNTLADVCVPLFFFISGYLFFYNADVKWNVYKKKLSRRVDTLLVPYIAWNFIGFIILLIELHPLLSSLFPLLKDYRIDIETFLSYFWVAELPVSMNGPSNPIDTPLWYVRDLMVLCVASPLIYYLIRKLKYCIIVLLALVWVFGWGRYAGIPSLSHQSLFFFPLGAYFSISGINFAEYANRMKYSVFVYCIVILADMLCYKESYGHWIHQLDIVVGMIAMTSVASWMVARRGVKANVFLSNASFFIFALHNLILGKFTKIIVMMVHPHSPALVLAIYFLVPVTVILIGLGAYWLLRTHTPSLAKILAGNR